MYKYQMIARSLMDELSRGRWAKGDRLPSIRQLVQDYQANKSTILQALNLLVDQNWLYVLDKSGYYVMKEMNLESSLNLASPKTFPSQDFQRCLHQVLENQSGLGFSSFREELADPGLLAALEQLLPTYGVYPAKGSLQVTAGAIQALYLLFNILQSRGKILVDLPTYPPVLDLLKALGRDYLTIPRGPDGVDLDLLESMMSNGDLAAFYTISRFSQPYQYAYRLKDQQALVKLCHKYGVYLIEDDYMADFALATSQTLHYLDTHERVIYLRTFSSIIYPNFKLAALVLPPSLALEFASWKRLVDGDSNLLIQQAFAIYLDNGMFQGHKRSMVEAYHKQVQAIQESLGNLSGDGFGLAQTQLVLSQSWANVLGLEGRALKEYDGKDSLGQKVVSLRWASPSQLEELQEKVIRQLEGGRTS